MDIEWYRDLAIAVMGLMSVVLALALTIVILLIYGKLRGILNGVQRLEDKTRELSEQRLAGINLTTLLGAVGMLAGTGVYSYRARKARKKAEKASTD